MKIIVITLTSLLLAFTSQAASVVVKYKDFPQGEFLMSAQATSNLVASASGALVSSNAATNTRLDSYTNAITQSYNFTQAGLSKTSGWDQAAAFVGQATFSQLTNSWISAADQAAAMVLKTQFWDLAYSFAFSATPKTNEWNLAYNFYAENAGKVAQWDAAYNVALYSASRTNAWDSAATFAAAYASHTAGWDWAASLVQPFNLVSNLAVNAATKIELEELTTLVNAKPDVSYVDSKDALDRAYAYALFLSATSTNGGGLAASSLFDRYAPATSWLEYGSGTVWRVRLTVNPQTTNYQWYAYTTAQLSTTDGVAGYDATRHPSQAAAFMPAYSTNAVAGATNASFCSAAGFYAVTNNGFADFGFASDGSNVTPAFFTSAGSYTAPGQYSWNAPGYETWFATAALLAADTHLYAQRPAVSPNSYSISGFGGAKCEVVAGVRYTVNEVGMLVNAFRSNTVVAATVTTNREDVLVFTNGMWTAIGSNGVLIAANTAQISTNTSQIATNTSQIATNTSQIATNTANIATNTANISALSTQKLDKASTNGWTVSAHEDWITLAEVPAVDPTRIISIDSNHFVRISNTNLVLYEIAPAYSYYVLTYAGNPPVALDGGLPYQIPVSSPTNFTQLGEISQYVIAGEVPESSWTLTVNNYGPTSVSANINYASGTGNGSWSSDTTTSPLTLSPGGFYDETGYCSIDWQTAPTTTNEVKTFATVAELSEYVKTNHTGDVRIDGLVEAYSFNLSTNYVATGTERLGTLYWDTASQTLVCVYPNGQLLNIGEEDPVPVQNDTGHTITNGMVVMYVGAIGNSGNIRVAPAYLLPASDPRIIIGMATTDIPSGSTGKVTRRGKVRGIKTNGSQVGETWVNTSEIYVTTNAALAGFCTTNRPQAPFPAVRVAKVTASHASNGTYDVDIEYPSKLTDLTDVDGTPLSTTGQIPIWDQTRQVFDFNYNFVLGTNALWQGLASKYDASNPAGYISVADRIISVNTNHFVKITDTNLVLYGAADVPETENTNIVILAVGESSQFTTNMVFARAEAQQSNSFWWDADQEAWFALGDDSTQYWGATALPGGPWVNQAVNPEEITGVWGTNAAYVATNVVAVFAKRSDIDAYVKTNHTDLINRDATDSHPIEAVTGLTEALAGKVETNDTKYLNAITNGQSGATLGATTFNGNITATGKSISADSFDATGGFKFSAWSLKQFPAVIDGVGGFGFGDTSEAFTKAMKVKKIVTEDIFVSNVFSVASATVTNKAVMSPVGTNNVATVWKGTYAEYVALPDKTNTTTYIITDDIVYDTKGIYSEVYDYVSVYPTTTVQVVQDKAVYTVLMSTNATITVDTNNVNLVGKVADYTLALVFTNNNVLSPTFCSCFDWGGYIPEFTVTGRYEFACTMIGDGKVRIKQTYPTVYQWVKKYFSTVQGIGNLVLSQSAAATQSIYIVVDTYAPCLVRIPRSTARTASDNPTLSWYANFYSSGFNDVGFPTNRAATTTAPYDTFYLTSVYNNYEVVPSQNRYMYWWVMTMRKDIAVNRFDIWAPDVRRANELEVMAYSGGKTNWN